MPSDSYHIDTPEQVAIEFDLAGVGSRGLALALDYLIVGGVMAAALAGVAILRFESGPFTRWISPTWVAALLALGGFAINWGYFAAFEALWRGQTPGKRALKIRVLAESGRRASGFEAMTRNLIRIIDFLPGMYGAGVVCMLINRNSQRLGDLAAGTVVVHERRTGLPRASAPAEGGQFFPGGGGAGAPGQFEAQLELIETFLQRRADFSPAMRTATAARIAAQFERQLGGAAGRPQDDESFLEVLAAQIREAAQYQAPHGRRHRP